MKSRHTPAPWKVIRATTFNNPDENNALIEYYWIGYGPVGDEMPVLARHLNENYANAHLIAAAPELLEACEIAEKYFREMIIGPETHYPEVSMLRSAIAKAKGES